LTRRGLLTELCGPELGLTYGIYKLKQLEKRFLSKVSVNLGFDEALIAAYNAGSPRRKPDGSWENQGYVDKVKRAYEHLQTKGIK
jgi:soluble lytic murein transglycosylase-like protein